MLKQLKFLGVLSMHLTYACAGREWHFATRSQAVPTGMKWSMRRLRVRNRDGEQNVANAPEALLRKLNPAPPEDFKELGRSEEGQEALRRVLEPERPAAEAPDVETQEPQLRKNRWIPFRRSG